MGLFSFSKRAPKSAIPAGGTPATLDANKIYPYLVGSGYIQQRPPQTDGVIHPLGHEIFVTLVQDHGGIVGNITWELLEAAHLTPQQAHAKAIENLAVAVQAQTVAIRSMNGPQGKPFIIFGGHWLAAACVLLPRLRDLAMANLRTERFCICIPHRDAMLLFPAADEAFRREMMGIIRENESDEPKPLTFELFEFDGERIREFRE